MAPPSADPSAALDVETESRARLVAFYLPQFHPIPENDAGGARASPSGRTSTARRAAVRGPLPAAAPGELGFYDLRDPEVLRAPGGAGRELRHQRLLLLLLLVQRATRCSSAARRRCSLADDRDFPFCICWANENWTRRWDGLEHEVLLRQEYEGDWAERFIRDALPIRRRPVHARRRRGAPARVPG